MPLFILLLCELFIVGLDSMSMKNNIISVLIINSNMLIIDNLFIDSFSILCRNFKELNFIFIYCLFFNKWKIRGNDTSGRNHKNIDEIKLIVKCKVKLKIWLAM